MNAPLLVSTNFIHTCSLAVQQLFPGPAFYMCWNCATSKDILHLSCNKSSVTTLHTSIVTTGQVLFVHITCRNSRHTGTLHRCTCTCRNDSRSTYQSGHIIMQQGRLYIIVIAGPSICLLNSANGQISTCLLWQKSWCFRPSNNFVNCSILPCEYY